MRGDEVSSFRAVELLVCPLCGRRYPASLRFCAADGRALEAVRAADPLVGTVVGVYRVDRHLGGGGSGRVYRATHVGTGEPCALKLLDAEITATEDGMQRVRREAANHARLGAHPHVCRLLDVGTAATGAVYIALEHVDGETLHALLEREVRLAPPRAARIVRQTASALAAAHALGLVHRDLKPDNVMLRRAPDGADHVVLIDFGIAKQPADAGQRLTRTGVAVGTPQFMSPEQLAAERVDARSDVYSLGLVAFKALTGALPFPSKGPQAMLLRMTGRLEPLAAVHPAVRWPVALQRCLDRALALEPADRPATADAFAEELGRVVDAWWSGADREVDAGVVALPRAAEAGPAPAAPKGGLLGRLLGRTPPAGDARERNA